MIELGPVLARPTDLLRLLVVPVFAWAAVHDVRTRRLPNRLWPPLLAFGALLLAVDGYRAWSTGGFEWQTFAIGAGISIGFVVPLAYVFWLLGGFGGADVKALATLAVLFPTFPEYWIGSTVLPTVETTVGAFAFTILTNAVVVGLFYPAMLALYNLRDGRRSPWMLVGLVQWWDDLETTHGRLLERPEGRSRDGLDLDALRMYLRWRGIDLADVRERPDELRDPASLPADPEPPGDGAVATDGVPASGASGGSSARSADGGEASDASRTSSEPGSDGSEPNDTTSGEPADSDDGTADVPTDVDDPWGAEAFVDAVGYEPYGTSAEDLRDGLETISRRDELWVSPGIPFIVPVFVGLVVALTYGDLLFGVLQWIGLG